MTFQPGLGNWPGDPGFSARRKILFRTWPGFEIQHKNKRKFRVRAVFCEALLSTTCGRWEIVILTSKSEFLE